MEIIAWPAQSRTLNASRAAIAIGRPWRRAA